MQLSEIDDILIRYGDVESAAALSFRLKGILSPSQCAARLTSLLEAPDWLTQAQKDVAITLKMQRLVNKLEDLPPTTRSIEVALAGLERIGNRLDKRVQATQADLTKLYAFQGSVLLDAITIALAKMKELLAPDEDQNALAAWDGALENGLRAAQLELSRHEDGYVDPEEDEDIVDAEVVDD